MVGYDKNILLCNDHLVQFDCTLNHLLLLLLLHHGDDNPKDCFEPHFLVSPGNI